MTVLVVFAVIMRFYACLCRFIPILFVLVDMWINEYEYVHVFCVNVLFICDYLRFIKHLEEVE